jgi:hypothetical protein
MGLPATANQIPQIGALPALHRAVSETGETRSRLRRQGATSVAWPELGLCFRFRITKVSSNFK